MIKPAINPPGIISRFMVLGPICSEIQKVKNQHEKPPRIYAKDLYRPLTLPIIIAATKAMVKIRLVKPKSSKYVNIFSSLGA